MKFSYIWVSVYKGSFVKYISIDEYNFVKNCIFSCWYMVKNIITSVITSFDAKSGSYIVQDIFECIYLKSRQMYIICMYPILLCRGHKFELNDKLKFYYLVHSNEKYFQSTLKTYVGMKKHDCIFLK